MAAANGRVFAFGSDRHIYCLDAVSGDLIWRSIYPNYYTYQNTRSEHMHKLSQFRRDRDGNNYMLHIDGVLVTGGNDNGTKLAGFDASSGELLWQNSGWLTKTSNPKIWRYNGKGYVIAAGFGKVALIDLLTAPFSGH